MMNVWHAVMPSAYLRVKTHRSGQMAREVLLSDGSEKELN
ncbi:hypothetical protein LUTEI9C_140269 [Luteimonas sp. 9C]|nr:hypothetical protein LUTEI9C_140269 [Luteimonas sp. 9C]